MRLLMLIMMISLLVVAGCATQTGVEETEEVVEETATEDVKIVKPCPDTCDDDNPDTEDVCNEDTDYECEHTVQSSTELLEGLMRDINEELRKKYVYTPEEAGKVTHYISHVDSMDEELIVLDVLDYELDSETATELYFKGQMNGFFMDQLDSYKEAYEEYIVEDDYYFEGKGTFQYSNHTIQENMYYDNLTMTDLGHYESLYSSIDLIEVNVQKHSNERDYDEQRFLVYVPFNYRLSVVCKPNIVVHLYPLKEEYKETSSNDFIRTQETSYVINHAREVRDDMMKKADRIAELCD